MLSHVFILNATRPNASRKSRRASTDVFGEMTPSWATVKALLVLHSTTLWIGTRAGHILLVELTNRQLLQAISLHCHSVRSMASVLIGTEQIQLSSIIVVCGARVHFCVKFLFLFLPETLNRKNVIMVLGKRQRLAQDQVRNQCGRGIL